MRAHGGPLSLLIDLMQIQRRPVYFAPLRLQSGGLQLIVSQAEPAQYSRLLLRSIIPFTVCHIMSFMAGQ